MGGNSGACCEGQCDLDRFCRVGRGLRLLQTSCEEPSGAALIAGHVKEAILLVYNANPHNARWCQRVYAKASAVAYCRKRIRLGRSNWSTAPRPDRRFTATRAHNTTCRPMH